MSMREQVLAKFYGCCAYCAMRAHPENNAGRPTSCPCDEATLATSRTLRLSKTTIRPAAAATTTRACSTLKDSGIVSSL